MLASYKIITDKYKLVSIIKSSHDNTPFSLILFRD